MKILKLLTAGILIFSVAIGYGATTGKRQSTTITALSNDANGIFEDQTGTAITLDGALVAGGVATSSAAQQVSIEGTGNNSGITFAIVGTDADGKAHSETLTGANNGTATTTLYFKTVTSITPSGAITGNVEGGWLSANGAVSASLVPDLAGYTALMSIVVDSCTCTYTVEHTSYNTPSAADQLWFSTVGLTSQTADAEGNIVAAVGGVRLKVTAYTSGSAQIMILQGSIR